jgi:ketosteroid isomerase-like protein
MSGEKVEVVRAQFEATNDRDFTRAMSFYAEDVVLIVHPNAFLQGGKAEGRDAVGAWFGDWFATFEPGYRFEIDEARELSEGVILLIATHSGRGRASGVEVGGQNGYLYTVRDGKIVRVEIYRTADEAREAAAGD